MRQLLRTAKRRARGTVRSITPRPRPTIERLTQPAPEPGPADWNDEGVEILPGLIDDEMIDAYERAWIRDNGRPGQPHVGARSGGGAALLNADRDFGWPGGTAYMAIPEILDLAAPLAPHLERLIGEPAAMTLNLTGWRSTERNWHQDSYLNEPEVGDFYAAAWIALGDIHQDSGPFQYVPGSHRWPQVTRKTIGKYVDVENPDWPWHSEQILTPLFEAEIERRGVEPAIHLPKKGDVLIWHGRLMHRGSAPNVPGAYRPAFIAHFSGVNHRPSLPTAVRHANGGWYSPIQSSAQGASPTPVTT